jgi:hypothetical protein
MEHDAATLARRLHAWGLEGLALALLEGAGPLTFLGAQAVHFAQPLLAPFVPAETVNALARVLEDPDAARAFAEELQKADA